MAGRRPPSCSKVTKFLRADSICGIRKARHLAFVSRHPPGDAAEQRADIVQREIEVNCALPGTAWARARDEFSSKIRLAGVNASRFDNALRGTSDTGR